MTLIRPFSPANPPQAPAGTPQIQQIPLENIAIQKLQRDRSYSLNPQLDDLKTSILAVGLSNPIRVEALGNGRFELVQGWRRLAAYRALLAETGDPRFASIAASPMDDDAPIEALYRRMVDENMVRKDISLAEMARLAIGYASDPATDCSGLDQAVNHLFASASPQKRSYVRRFTDLMYKLEKVLEHPEAIPRALGLALVQALETDPIRIRALSDALRDHPRRDVATELNILRCFAGQDPEDDDASISPRGNQRIGSATSKPARGRPAKRNGAQMRLDLMGGAVSCTVAPGRVDLRLDRDFTSLPRQRLEAAVAAFCAALG